MLLALAALMMLQPITSPIKVTAKRKLFDTRLILLLAPPIPATSRACWWNALYV
jgi:hypothetical protein